jgi:MoaA/NifB/PqqE/SkfB family radical SAM enzyme
MKDRVRRAYDSTRDFSGKSFHSACYAPFTSLYFDALGQVRVCCHNIKYPVGHVLTDTIDDIWNGERIASLRAALKHYEFTRGCDFCDWRASFGLFSSLTMKSWDQFPVREFAPAWPNMMEFSVSNSCNLECIMCHGEASSAIRAKRDKLPPLPKAYGDSFFLQLSKYLPHLKRAKFLGGEPFLQQECFRIWQMMIDQGLQTACHVTTNGTQWNSRIERVFSRLPFEVTISMDGFTRKTVESIRVGASHDSILANFRSFHAYSRANNTPLSLTFCLMPQNYQELGEFCLFADEWECSVFVNTVRTPSSCSLYALPRQELQQIVAAMENEAATLLPRLRRSLPVWFGEFERLRNIVRKGTVVPRNQPAS